VKQLLITLRDDLSDDVREVLKERARLGSFVYLVDSGDEFDLPVTKVEVVGEP